MIKIPVIWQSYDKDTPGRGYWDMGMIESLFSGDIWRVPNTFEFEHYGSFKELPSSANGAVVVFPARAQVANVNHLNHDISKLSWVIIMLTGDEESVFPYEKIKHRNKKLWVMSPRPNRHADVTMLGTGWPPQARELIKDCYKEYVEKPLDYYFAGQVTHERRQQMAEQLGFMAEREDMNGEYLASPGFTQGLEPADYFKKLSSAKVAPCPSGPETPDSFRLFEALEAGCIPIADTRVPKGDFPDNYWELFFGEIVPFPVLTLYEQLPGYTLAALEDWKPLSNKIFAWWLLKKRQMAYTLHSQIEVMTGTPTVSDPRDQITVMIPSSPVESHPSTEAIERTIHDIRVQLPRSEIIITFDGVRSEQEHYRQRYDEYKRRVIWMCHHKWHNVLPILFDVHMHQAKMAKEALKLITTPIMLYVEHDAPIVPDCDFDWEKLVASIFSGEANVIRFHHEAGVLPDHEHMMMGPVEEIAGGLPVRKTRQWSQRPHLASVAFYRTMLDSYFNPDSRTMIEDVIHGYVDQQCLIDGQMGWYNWRLWIYHPYGNNIKRSYHIDTRGKDPKFEMEILPLERKDK